MNYGKQTAIFDTSALNKLLKDPGAEPFKAGVKAGYDVPLMAMSIDEFVATQETEVRRALLVGCRELSQVCLMPAHMVLEKMIEARSKSHESFDWERVNIRLPIYEEALGRGDYFEDDRLSAEMREHAKATSDEFESMHAPMNAELQRLFDSGTEQRPTDFRDALTRITVKGGAFWTYARLIYEHETKCDPGEDAMRSFLDSCPPVRALNYAFALAWFHRCIRLPNTLSFGAKRVDLFMSTFLPYCDFFVSRDEKQIRCLAEIAAVAGLKTEVLSLETFFEKFMIHLGEPVSAKALGA